MTSTQKIKKKKKKNDSLLCIGLDTDVQKIPESIRRAKYPQHEFNKKIIEATKDLVCAYKLNLAFYEAAGKPYSETIHKTLKCIP
ncbi:MAG: orotidine 5'-phosphate decarboxylase, partial [Ignavibacteriales bacterium]|nr:orotidine 5'-phosphate decarboxylase [Ignavibacteriales bacterium]